MSELATVSLAFGGSTSADPGVCSLREVRDRTVTAGKRADLLLTLHSSLAASDGSVRHLGASSYAGTAAVTAGSAAADRNRQERNQYKGVGVGGYASIPLSSETYGRRGAPVWQLLNHLATMAAASRAGLKAACMLSALRYVLCFATLRAILASAAKGRQTVQYVITPAVPPVP